MAVDLSVKQVPDAVADRLRQRAERNHRSLQGELRAILEAATQSDPSAPSVLREAAVTYVTSPGTRGFVTAPQFESVLMPGENRDGRQITIDDLHAPVASVATLAERRSRSAGKPKGRQAVQRSQRGTSEWMGRQETLAQVYEWVKSQGLGGTGDAGADVRQMRDDRAGHVERVLESARTPRRMKTGGKARARR